MGAARGTDGEGAQLALWGPECLAREQLRRWLQELPVEVARAARHTCDEP